MQCADQSQCRIEIYAACGWCVTWEPTAENPCAYCNRGAPLDHAVERCGKVNRIDGYVCGREKGHTGVHITFFDNLAVGWGKEEESNDG